MASRRLSAAEKSGRIVSPTMVGKDARRAAVVKATKRVKVKVASTSVSSK